MLATLDIESTEVQSLCSVNPFTKQKDLIVIRGKNTWVLMSGGRS